MIPIYCDASADRTETCGTIRCTEGLGVAFLQWKPSFRSSVIGTVLPTKLPQMGKYPLQPGDRLTREQMDEWREIRERGFRRYAIRFGGMLCAFHIVGLATMYGLSYVIPNYPQLLHDLPIQLLPTIPMMPFLGWFFAAQLWRDLDAKYEWTLTNAQQESLNDTTTNLTA